MTLVHRIVAVTYVYYYINDMIFGDDLDGVPSEIMGAYIFSAE
jgi:hypothetical protein